MKPLSFKQLSLLSLVLVTGACSSAGFSVGSVMERLKSTPPLYANYKEAMMDRLNTQDYSKWLQKDYKALALFEYDQMFDYDSAEHFARKSLDAGKGIIPGPDAVSSRDIRTSHQEEARSMYTTVLDAYAQKKDAYFPEQMARLQASYDCWLEQTEEDVQPNHILKCKDLFYGALGQMKGMATTVVVYFDNDAFTLVPDEAQKLRAVVNNHNVSRGRIVIEGHTDRRGTDDYNLALSQRRADSAGQAIQALDPHITDIETEALGESRPAIPTADGASEPRNRRAIIHFE